MSFNRSRTEGDSRTSSAPGRPRRKAGPAGAPTGPAHAEGDPAGTPRPPVPETPAAPDPSGADEIDRLQRRMDRAVGGFVDDPRRAVREADAVLDETARRLTRLLEERREALRGSWHEDNGTRTGTEELRVVLTRYRDMTRELLHVG